ncbi:non-ribosomal peptide synthetase [Streptomyces apocyni]|uniref:non-ribosomal peptide synthetase n=1 Tax=Streptomyces apocyni TaxID=2654677 RepID=UPI0018D1430B|nr:amino acid adenylation domain-containing protein [Streptomyces apocyni]
MTAWTAPLTESQIGLLLVQRTVTAQHLYNIVAVAELDPAYQASEVRAALTQVLTVQPALRMALWAAPQPHATLAPPPTPEQLPLTERVVGDPAQSPAQALGETDTTSAFERQLRQVIDELSAVAFDFTRPPLVRFALLRTESGDRSTLVLTVHHTVFDGYSLRPLLQDLNAALRGELDPAALRPARERALLRELQAQHDAAADPAVATAAAELGKRLRDTPATVIHPRPGRPVETAFAGRRRVLRLGAGRSAAVDQACGQLSITPFVFFCAVYGAVLARHSGHAAVTIGSPLLSRRTVGSYSLCGFFVNTLPLVLETNWDTPFAQYVADVVAPEVRSVKRNAAVPFSQIVRHAAPDRSSNRNPLFSTMLAMQDSTVVEQPHAVRSVHEPATGVAKFDLWLGVTPTADGWLIELDHDPDLIPDTVAEGLLVSLSEAIDRAATDATTPLRALFSDASLELIGATDGYGCAPPADDLDAWFQRTVLDHADRIAVEEPGRKLTYAELDAAVRASAEGLRERGVTPGQGQSQGHTVGLTTANLTDTVVAILAVLRLGAAFLPLDLTLPPDRLAYMVDKADCSLVVGEGSVPGAVVVAPRELAQATTGSHPHPHPHFGSEGWESDRQGGSGGYVMFTSGSTGKPKGVAMGNGPLLNLAAWQLDAFAMDSGTRFLQYAPLGFDVSFQEILPTLLSGGTVVSRAPADRRDLPAVVRRVVEAEVTHVYLPVAALRPFVRAADGVTLDRVTHICVSGEQLVVDQAIEDFFTRHPHIQLINLYGPTETHAVTTQRLSAADPSWPAHVPIGRPVSGVTAQVVDHTGHLAPLGVAGELLLGGRCPASGYVNDRERTDERFVPDPYGEAGARRYRTGDQVLWDESGVLVFLGRDDHQVKIRGFRVELGEIESAALGHPGVREAVAAARGDGADRHLLLFLLPHTDATGSLAQEVDRLLGDQLPGYMVPARVLVVDAMPTTGNGKFDRPALLGTADELIARAEHGGHRGPEAAPADELESWLLQLWSEVLGRTDLAVDRSLLECGAHSLNVLTALSQIEQRRGVRVAVLDFFRAPTIRALAGLLHGAEASS